MRMSILLSLLMLSSWSGTTTAQSDSEFNIKSLAKEMESRFERCPRREVVAKFDRKHHKQVWEKQAWGPPTDVFADVKPNDSILYPYVLTIEFSLSSTFGPERESRAEAERDTNLSQISGLAALLKGKYRKVYLVGRHDIHLKSRELLREGTWEERPSWPDACWDQIGVK